MVNCCAIGCTNSDKKKRLKKIPNNVTFHRFPQDPVRRQDWTRRLRRLDFTSSKFTHICSEHFSPQCFEVSVPDMRVKRTLKRSAVPTIFNFPDATPTPTTPKDDAVSRLKLASVKRAAAKAGPKSAANKKDAGPSKRKMEMEETRELARREGDANEERNPAERVQQQKDMSAPDIVICPPVVKKQKPKPSVVMFVQKRASDVQEKECLEMLNKQELVRRLREANQEIKALKKRVHDLETYRSEHLAKVRPHVQIIALDLC